MGHSGAEVRLGSCQEQEPEAKLPQDSWSLGVMQLLTVLFCMRQVIPLHSVSVMLPCKGWCSAYIGLLQLEDA